MEAGRKLSPVVFALAALAACADLEHAEYPDQPEAPRARAAPPLDSAAMRLRLDSLEDSVQAAFGRSRRLRWREVFTLRRDKNAEQIAVAQRMGARVSDSTEVQRRLASRRLVPLRDSTEFWVLRRMEHSVPYMTPEALAMLERLGARFHERLDSLGIPPYRMKVTSVLRTDETQAALRRINPNASRTVSAHEYGTTLDVSHTKFAAPPGPEAEAELLEDLGEANWRILQAELGRALLELRRDGLLMVMMENGQPVYHMTVARAPR
jgi:hypothetical protein